MKTNLKYQNGRLMQEPKKNSPRTSLLRCALNVLGAYLVCSLVLSPLSASLRESYDYMTSDVEYNGTLIHTLTYIGSVAFFYLSSLLSTAAFFIGASYIVNCAIARRKNKALGAAAITLAGMNIGTLLSLAAFVFLRISNPRVSIPDSTMSTFLYEGLFYLGCVAAMTAAVFLLCSRNAPLYLYSVSCAVIMFIGSAGLELFENTRFFLSGTILTEDVIKMILSMLLHVLHAGIGFLIMLRMTRREKIK